MERLPTFQVEVLNYLNFYLRKFHTIYSPTRRRMFVKPDPIRNVSAERPGIAVLPPQSKVTNLTYWYWLPTPTYGSGETSLGLGIKQWPVHS